jgi:hypothetical protein
MQDGGLTQAVKCMLTKCKVQSSKTKKRKKKVLHAIWQLWGARGRGRGVLRPVVSTLGLLSTRRLSPMAILN